jgi:hypothetical protein
VTEDGEGYDYTDEELAEMTAWVEPALQELRDERALTADALALVAQVASSSPLIRMNWAYDRLCRYCLTVILPDLPHEDGHADSCLWLACRRLTERAAALGEWTPDSAPDATTATESAGSRE